MSESEDWKRQFWKVVGIAHEYKYLQYDSVGAST